MAVFPMPCTIHAGQEFANATPPPQSSPDGCRSGPDRGHLRAKAGHASRRGSGSSARANAATRCSCAPPRSWDMGRVCRLLGSVTNRQAQLLSYPLDPVHRPCARAPPPQRRADRGRSRARVWGEGRAAVGLAAPASLRSPSVRAVLFRGVLQSRPAILDILTYTLGGIACTQAGCCDGHQSDQAHRGVALHDSLPKERTSRFSSPGAELGPPGSPPANHDEYLPPRNCSVSDR